MNFIVLTLTFGTLIWYTYDTHRIANQTTEANLRPVILRSGFIPTWEDINFVIEGNSELKTGPLVERLEFSIFKNIAKDISGHIILNGKKYKLLFANSISTIEKSDKKQLLQFEENWGWMNAESKIYAIFNEKNYEQVSDKNEIFIKYRDIEGNQYYTKEDSNFSQISKKL